LFSERDSFLAVFVRGSGGRRRRIFVKQLGDFSEFVSATCEGKWFRDLSLDPLERSSFSPFSPMKSCCHAGSQPVRIALIRRIYSDDLAADFRQRDKNPVFHFSFSFRGLFHRRLVATEKLVTGVPSDV